MNFSQTNWIDVLDGIEVGATDGSSKSLAEGVVYAPILSTFDSGRKGDSPPSKTRKALGEFLRKTFEKARIRDSTMALRLGVSLGTLKNWKFGRTEPSKRFWPRLNKILAGAQD